MVLNVWTLSLWGIIMMCVGSINSVKYWQIHQTNILNGIECFTGVYWGSWSIKGSLGLRVNKITSYVKGKQQYLIIHSQ